MKIEWIDSNALAGLPGLPSAPNKVRAKAKREGWVCREVAVRGGRQIQYHIDSLPEAARAELVTREAARNGISLSDSSRIGIDGASRLFEEERTRKDDALRAREAGLALYAQLPPDKQRQADARFAILTARDSFLAAARLKKGRGTAIFVARVNSEEIPLEDHHRASLSRNGSFALSTTSVKRWEKSFRDGGLAALSSGFEGRRGSRSLTEAMQQLCIGVLCEHFSEKAEFHLRAINARFPEDIAPSVHAVRRFIANWMEANRTYYEKMKNPDKWRSHYQFAIGDQAEGIDRLNQLWEMDSTPADILLADGGRYTIIGCIDIYSRRLKLHVSPTSKSLAVAALIRRSMLDWGVPEAIKTDNGADYVAHYLEHVLYSLEIGHPVCQPFEPQQKPFVERGLGTFSHDLLELMPGFIGHSVADRKDIEARRSFADRMMKKGEEVELKTTAEELQKFADKWCDIYHHRSHSGLDGATPFELVQRWTDPVRTIAHERALDVLLAPLAGQRTIGKKGIRVSNLLYASPELAGHEGERVLVKLDPADLGRIYVFDLDNIFIGIAIDPTAPEIDRAEFAAKVSARQRAVNNEGTKVLRSVVKKMATADIGREIIEAEAAKIGNLEAFPAPSVNHTAAALEHAADAVRARDLQDSFNPVGPTEEEIAKSDQLLDQADERRREDEALKKEEAAMLLQVDFKAGAERARDQQGRPIFDSAADRYEWLLDRVRKGAPVAEEEFDWMRKHEEQTFGEVMTK